ncbi:hypothetical protein EJB05_14273, partial [Eragrostis curvula]
MPLKLLVAALHKSSIYTCAQLNVLEFVVSTQLFHWGKEKSSTQLSQGQESIKAPWYTFADLLAIPPSILFQESVIGTRAKSRLLMADTVASSVVQEGVSWMSSYISGKLEEKVSEGHIMARLEMALSQLEFALERTGKLPIMHQSLLRRWKMFKEAYTEGMDLLSKHKLQLVEGGKEMAEQGVTGSSFLERIPRAKNLPISSLFGLSKEYLSSSVVKKFEWYADCADKFVTDVVSGCPLRHDAFVYPLERQLLEGKILMYKMVNGSQSRRIAMWPICSEGRGIEVELYFSYEDRKMPVKKFFLLLRQRLSQGTSIVETATRCLQFATESLKLPTSQFKCVAESAIDNCNKMVLIDLYRVSLAEWSMVPAEDEPAEDKNTV